MTVNAAPSAIDHLEFLTGCATPVAPVSGTLQRVPREHAGTFDGEQVRALVAAAPQIVAALRAGEAVVAEGGTSIEHHVLAAALDDLRAVRL